MWADLPADVALGNSPKFRSTDNWQFVANKKTALLLVISLWFIALFGSLVIIAKQLSTVNCAVYGTWKERDCCGLLNVDPGRAWNLNLEFLVSLFFFYSIPFPETLWSTTGGVIAESVSGLTESRPDTMRITKGGVVAEKCNPAILVPYSLYIFLLLFLSMIGTIILSGGGGGGLHGLGFFFIF